MSGHIPTAGAQRPRRGDGVFWVRCLKGTQRVQFRIYSPAIWGCWTHYANKQTSPCYVDENHCHKAGHDPVTLRYKGYVLGWNFTENRVEFLQLTPGAIESWERQIATGTILRGMNIYCERTEKGNGRLGIKVNEYQAVDPKGLPPDVDPRASLYNTWGLTDHGWKWATHPRQSLDLLLPMAERL